MVGEPYGKMIGIGVSGLIVYQFQEMWEGGLVLRERNLPRYSCRHQHGCGSFIR